jgi:ribosomal protein S18 acetylase RimI-like enzyme
MAGLRSVANTMRRVVAGVRTNGMGVTFRRLRRRAGIHFVRFHWVKELLPANLSSHLAAFPEGFEFSVFGADDIAIISTFPEAGAPFTEAGVLKSLERGHTCLGLKYNGEIVAFTWYALDATHSTLYPATMKPNEAYLFNMYVKPAVRGQNIASALRYRTYAMLRELGRDTFYSITVTSNKASWRFKEKLNARRVLLVWYFAFQGRFDRRWVVRRY